MNSNRVSILILLLLIAGIAIVHSQAPSKDETTGRLIVKLRQDCSQSEAKTIVRELGGELVAYRSDSQTGLMTVSQETRNIRRKKGWGHKLVLYIEPEILMYAMSAPNDPLYANQWNFQDSGYGIRLTSARELADGNGVIVAVVDTGIRRDTPDLGGTQFTAGFDIINNDSDATDDNGHGTHVAGTIAQTTDNGYGAAGIAPRAQLMPVKVLAANGSGSNYSVAAGIRWAVDHGARIINMSLGGGGSQTLLEAIRYAVGKGCVIVCAAGNSGAQGLSYPAAYPECISVAATDKNGQKASFSQYGAGLTISAPGVDIQQNTFNPQTGQFGFPYWRGTSMATPHVAGVAALVRQLNSALSPSQVKELLQRTAIDRGATGYDVVYGAGIVDALAACHSARGTAPGPTPDPTPVPPVPPSGNPEADRVFILTNQERAKVGVAALRRAVELDRAAQKHATDMAVKGYFSHYSQDGSSPGDRILREGYRWMTFGENIGYGYRTPEDMVAAWMASSGHKANILRSTFKDIGVGFAKDNTGRPFYVEDFGAR